MREPKLIDYFLLTILALIWASAFFNIKIATYSYGPVTIAFLRIFFGAIPVVALCFFKGIRIEAFSKDWYWFASIGLINLVISLVVSTIIIYAINIIAGFAGADYSFTNGEVFVIWILMAILVNNCFNK